VAALSSGRDFLDVKGVIEAIVVALNPAVRLEARSTSQLLLDSGRSAELWVQLDAAVPLLLGYLGEVNADGVKRFDLRATSCVAELKLETLQQIALLIPQYRQPPVFPAVTRDLNLVVDESVSWADVEQTVRGAAPEAEAVLFQGVYRDAERLGTGKKSLLFTLTLRLREGTLTGEAADAISARVVAACQSTHAAQLRA
jgi:phenylalanyl-tRNA synthetase beta chain